MNGWRNLFPNAWYVAEREYRSRATSRSFLIGTVILAAIRLRGYTAAGPHRRRRGHQSDASRGRGSRRQHAVRLTGRDDGYSQRPDQLLHASSLRIELVPGRRRRGRSEVARRRQGRCAPARGPRSGEPEPVLHSANQPGLGRQPVNVITNAATYLALDDGLARAGTSIGALQRTKVTVLPVLGSSAGPVNSISREVSTNLLSTGLIVLIFMAIITYGTWVAMSVAEEKGSRVMELMLNATTPLQMLAGKVIGNGAAGLTQYGIILGAVIVGLLAQGPIPPSRCERLKHERLIRRPQRSRAGGVRRPVRARLRAVLAPVCRARLDGEPTGGRPERNFAADDADHDRLLHVDLRAPGDRRDVGQNRLVRPVLQPLPDACAGLGRARGGLGIRLAVIFLLVAIAIALVVAARIYSAGVLLYGQRVGFRQILRAARVSR